MGNLTIIHISDLHRDPSHEVTNQALLDSLKRDRDRYQKEESPSIPDPDVIIVSGDIVHGVKANATDAEAELKRQYEQAEEFLGALADDFVGGDREKIVLIPGNHDVSYYHTLQGMKQIDVNLNSIKGRAAAVSLGKQLRENMGAGAPPSTPVRWSWAGFCFYEIQDQDKYAARLGAFCEFYTRFYQGKRQYRLKPEEQFDVFDYPEHNVTIAGFSSCYGNDPLNRRGAIHPDSVATAVKQLSAPKHRGRLLLATWHHNTTGGPWQVDYMDADTLQVLIDDGFSIGFHGHQHRPQFIEERREFGSARKITVISAGSLCAGPKELPTGQTRAYNIIQLKPQEMKGILHLRQMQNENFGRPIWAPGYFVSLKQSYVEFDVERPVARSYEAEDLRIISTAETTMRKGQHREAAGMLKDLAASNALARKLLWECYVALEDHNAIAANFYPPTTAAEFIHVGEALVTLGDTTRLNAVLNLPFVRESVESAVVEARKRFAVRIK